jgi:hypothetical protein
MTLVEMELPVLCGNKLKTVRLTLEGKLIERKG